MSGGGGLKLPVPEPEPPDELSPCQWGDIPSLPLPAGENKTIVTLRSPSQNFVICTILGSR